MSIAIRFAFLALVLSALFSCSSQPRTVITGRWQSLAVDAAGDIMEFSDDGKFIRTFVDESNGKTISGSYVLLDRNRIKITFEGKASILAPQVCRIEIKSDRLHWINPNGETEDFQKLK